MDDIVGVMRKIAANEAQRIYTTELGVVTEAFPHSDEGDKDNYQCSVKLLNRKQHDGSDFELKKVPVAVPYMGWACIPNKDDLVLIQFISGDINAPVITGRLYTEDVRPPENQPDEFLIQHKFDEGGFFKIDKDGKITLTSPNEENIITVEDDLISIVGDKYSITVDVSNKKIKIESDQDLELVATNGKCLIDVKELEIKTSGEAKFDAQGELSLKGSSIKSEAQGEFSLKGATFEAEASGTVKIKGAMIDMN